MAKMGITIYRCEQDEAVLFREVAPRFGVMPTITAAPVSEANIELAFGNQCISVSHKTQITISILRTFSQTGVVYIFTGCGPHSGFAATSCWLNRR